MAMLAVAKVLLTQMERAGWVELQWGTRKSDAASSSHPSFPFIGCLCFIILAREYLARAKDPPDLGLCLLPEQTHGPQVVSNTTHWQLQQSD